MLSAVGMMVPSKHVKANFQAATYTSSSRALDAVLCAAVLNTISSLQSFSMANGKIIIIGRVTNALASIQGGKKSRDLG